MSSGRHLVVLAGADAEAVDALAATLRDDGTVRTAYDSAALVETLGDEVDVVIVDRDLGDGPIDDVLDVVRAHDADCQVALLGTDADRSRGRVEGEVSVDAVVGLDEGEDAVRETVSRLAARARYRRRLDEYYELAEKRASLADAADQTRERDRLDRHVERLRRELADGFRRIDDASAFDAALSHHERDLTDSERSGPDGSGGSASTGTGSCDDGPDGERPDVGDE